MDYVVKDGKGCLLGKRDGEAMGLINISPEGTSTIKDQPEVQTVARMEMLQSKPDFAQDDDKLKDIQAQMDRIANQYPFVFSSIGKIRIKLINVYLMEEKVVLVAQKSRSLALHLMDPLKKHLEELVD